MKTWKKFAIIVSGSLPIFALCFTLIGFNSGVCITETQDETLLPKNENVVDNKNDEANKKELVNIIENCDSYEDLKSLPNFNQQEASKQIQEYNDYREYNINKFKSETDTLNNDVTDDGFYVNDGNESYEFTDDVLYVGNKDNIEISNINQDNPTRKRIVVDDNSVDVHIHLKGVCIYSDLGPALEVKNNSIVTITLEDDYKNYLCSMCKGCAGIQKNIKGESEDYRKVLSIIASKHRSNEPNLIVAGGEGAAGIGSAYNQPTSHINIRSGCSIYACGGEGAAGIGSGEGGDAQDISISSSKINVFSKNEGAGIGAGKNGTASKIRISDNADIFAIGGISGAGIGAGAHGKIENIDINNAKVLALGGIKAAGIGGGDWSLDYVEKNEDIESVSAIHIGGNSDVVALGGIKAAGIGGGDSTYINGINIDGGCIKAQGGFAAAGIGSGIFGAVKNIIITGGIVEAGASFCSVGIGAGGCSAVDGIYISGGTITAGDFSGLENLFCGGIGAKVDILNGEARNVVISGGSIKASSMDCYPKTQDGKDVYLLVVDNPNNGKVHLGSLDTEPYNPCNHSAALGDVDTKLYMYQPAPIGEDSGMYVYVDDKVYFCTCIVNEWDTVLVGVDNTWNSRVNLSAARIDDQSKLADLANLTLTLTTTCNYKINFNQTTGVYTIDFYYNRVSVESPIDRALYKPFTTIEIDPQKIFGDNDIELVNFYSPEGCVVHGGWIWEDNTVGKIIKGGNISLVFEKSNKNTINNLIIDNNIKLNNNLENYSATNNNKNFIKENNNESFTNKK